MSLMISRSPVLAEVPIATWAGERPTLAAHSSNRRAYAWRGWLRISHRSTTG